VDHILARASIPLLKLLANIQFQLFFLPKYLQKGIIVQMYAATLELNQTQILEVDSKIKFCKLTQGPFFNKI